MIVGFCLVFIVSRSFAEGQDVEWRDEKMLDGRHYRNVRETRLRWYGHVITRDEGELVRDIME